MKLFRSLRQRGRKRRLGDAHDGWTGAQWAPPACEAGYHRFVALQPIFDRRRKLFGYEALSRSKWENRFTGWAPLFSFQKDEFSLLMQTICARSAPRRLGRGMESRSQKRGLGHPCRLVTATPQRPEAQLRRRRNECRRRTSGWVVIQKCLS